MRLFGGLIPFFGFREHWVNNIGQRCTGRSHWKADLLVFEWLGFGWVLATGARRKG